MKCINIHIFFQFLFCKLINFKKIDSFFFENYFYKKLILNILDFKIVEIS